jgi:hypothetical protein
MPPRRLFRRIRALYTYIIIGLHGVRERIRLYLRLIHIRQIQGFPAPPASTDPIVCRNCGEDYIGSYCPRCGQSRKTYRFTFKRGIQNVLGGLTNIGNGFGRTLIELLFRPGYMISDFIAGKRVQYFRPFQTLFVLAAIYIFAAQYLFPGTIADEEKEKRTKLEAVERRATTAPSDATAATVDSTDVPRFIKTGNEKADDYFDRMIDGSERMKQRFAHNTFFSRVGTILTKWAHGNKAITIIGFIPFFAVATRMAFRRRKHNQGLNTTEYIFVQTYIACQMLLLSILYLPIMNEADDSLMFPIPWWLMILLFWWDYRQLFQCKWRRTLWNTLLMFFYYGLLIFAAAILFALLWFGLVWIVESL